VDLAKEFEGRVKVITIYTSEANPLDNWKNPNESKNPIKCYQPKTLDERINLANLYAEKYSYEIDMILDNMQNEFANKVAGGERLWIGAFVGKKMVMKSGEIPYEYDISTVKTWIKSHFKSPTKSHIKSHVKST